MQVAYAEFRFIFVLCERKPDCRKRHAIFLGLFYKSAKIRFYCECTQIKANLLQFQLSSWLKGVFASTVRRKNKSSDCSSAHARTQLSILPWQCSLFIIIIKNNQSNIWGKKHTAQFKYVVKICAFKRYHCKALKLCKTFCFTGYWNASEAGLHKR